MKNLRHNCDGDLLVGFNLDIFVSQPKSQPSEAVVIWKGGARERADDVLSFRRKKRTSEQSGLCSDVAQKEGFEPSRRFYPAYSLSRGAPSASWVLLQITISN